MYEFSIIIPLFNQIDMVSFHIKFYNALYKQRQDFEVLFTDDGSSDATPKHLDRNKNILFPYQYEWKEDVGFTVSNAKNRGIRLAKGKWLLIIDGDTFIDPQTLRAYDHVDKNKDTVYFGKRLPVKLKDLDKALKFGFPSIVLKKEDWRGFLQDIPPAPFWHFSGSNFIIHNQTAKQLEYAPDDWKGYGYDDYAMAIEYLTRGKKFQAVNDSIAYHCEDEPKEGDEVTRKRLNDFIKLKEPELRAKGLQVRYF